MKKKTRDDTRDIVLFTRDGMVETHITMTSWHKRNCLYYV